jgi:hypothetical protein
MDESEILDSRVPRVDATVGVFLDEMDGGEACLAGRNLRLQDEALNAAGNGDI